MRTRQLALTGAGIAVLALGAAGASPPLAASKPSCSAGSTLAVGKSARVFRTRSGTLRGVYGCSLSTKKVSFLGAVGGGKGVASSVLAVNGPRVAYVFENPNDQSTGQVVIVRDLKQRKVLSSQPATPGDGSQQVTDIVLTRSGTVAWISEVTLGMPPPLPTLKMRFVLARKPGQPLLPLASGLDIAPGSLALAGNTLYWQQPTAKSAMLP